MMHSRLGTRGEHVLESAEVRWRSGQTGVAFVTVTTNPWSQTGVLLTDGVLAPPPLSFIAE